MNNVLLKLVSQRKSLSIISNDNANSPWSSWISNTPSTTILLFGCPIDYSASNLSKLLKTRGPVKSIEKVPEGSVALADFVNLNDAQAFVEEYRPSRGKKFHVDGYPVSVEYSSHCLFDKQEATNNGVVLRLEFVPNNQVTDNPLSQQSIKLSCQHIAKLKNVMIGPIIVNEYGLESRCALLQLYDHEHANKLRESLLDETLKFNLSYNINRVIFSAFPDIASADDERENDSNSDINGSTNGFHFNNLTKEMRCIESSELPSRNFRSKYTSLSTLNSPVIFINNLNMDIFDCDRLYHFLIRFGEVIRIKFIRNRPGTALVQMDTVSSATTLFNIINRMHVFGAHLTVVPCKSTSINIGLDGLEPLKNGTPSCKTYPDDLLNQNSTNISRKKNPSALPSEKLVFFNAPLCMPLSTIENLCKEHNISLPIGMAFYEDPLQLNKSLRGTIEFATTQAATEALILLHNAQIYSDRTSHPFHLKLAFFISK